MFPATSEPATRVRGYTGATTRPVPAGLRGSVIPVAKLNTSAAAAFPNHPSEFFSPGRRFVPRRPHPDPVEIFSHRLTKIKFIILELVIFIGFLLWLWEKVKRDFGISFPNTPVFAASIP